jgi:hypothetical protein
MKRDILLLELNSDWAQKIIGPIQERGWDIFWTKDVKKIYQEKVEGIYLLSLAHTHLDVRYTCQWIRKQPKGENVSIFLLNDGQQPLKSFEESLRVGADALYFIHNQLPLLLSNFPVKQSHNIEHTTSFTPSTQKNSMLLDSSKSSPSSTHTHIGLPNQDRVAGISLTHLQKERKSFGYSTKTNLLLEQIQQAMQKPIPNSTNQPSVQGLNVPRNTQKIAPLPASNAKDSMYFTSNIIPKVDSPVNSQTPVLHAWKAPIEEVSTEKKAQASYSSSVDFATHIIPRTNSLNHQSVDIKSQSNDHHKLHHTSLADLSLRHFEWAKILATILRERKDCCILVQWNQEEWKFFLQKGQLRGLQGSHYVPYFLNFAYNEKVLSNQIIDEIRTLESEIDLVDYIIERELISIHTLERLMQNLALSQINRFFDITDASFEIQDYQRPQDTLHLNQSLLRILIQGVMDHYGRLKLYQCFTHHKSIPMPSGFNLFYHQFNATEQYLIQSCHRKEYSIAQIAQKHEMHVSTVLSFYYVCYLLGEITLHQHSPLMNYYKRLLSQDYFNILSLSYEANANDAKKAWREHRKWVSQQSDDRVDTKVMIDILDDAYRVLAHDVMRQRYLHSLQDPVVPVDQSQNIH